MTQSQQHRGRSHTTRACFIWRRVRTAGSGPLLDTNYKHEQAINLFQIAVERLVADYPFTAPGGISKTVGELWREVNQAKPLNHRAGRVDRVNRACAAFNPALTDALTKLHPVVGGVLGDLVGSDVVVSPFAFSGVTYVPARLTRDRIFAGCNVGLNVEFRSQALPTPQHFLNEARLSALALAIYLSGRIVSTPTATPDALKLLVLDDVLIGLDHSNRLPVLDVLQKHFSDWQIVLLTHDRVWFEMARFRLGVGDDWKCIEIFEGLDVTRGIPAPIVRPTSDKAARASLAQARLFLADHHVPAAANYTRAAFELLLKSFCERFDVPVAFRTDTRHLDTEKLLSAIEAWFKAHAAKTCMAGVVERVKLFRKVVLNPYSHASPPTIASAEVSGAIEAVARFAEVIEKGGLAGDAFQSANQAMAAIPPTPFEQHAALAFLRSGFVDGLRRFCNRKHVRIPYVDHPIDGESLWREVLAEQATLFPGAHVSIPPLIDAERRWLMRPIDESDLAVLTQGDLVRISAAVMKPGGAEHVLDGI